MSLSSASVSALRSLGVISDQISVASRNVAGAGVAGVSEKIARVSPGDSGVDFMGVTREANVALFRNLLSANSEQESANSVSGALSRLDLALGLSDASNSRSPAIQISKLGDALRAYSATPRDQTAAQIVLSTAQDVVSSLHDASAATQDERRRADQMIAEDVDDVNRLLSQFATLNETIVKATASRQDATDALDQRDSVLTELSKRIGISVVGRPNNDMVLYTDAGVTLYETTPRKVTFQETYNLQPGSIGADVYIDGARVTGSGASMALQSGSIIGHVKIRDQIAPQYQSQLDEIARGLVVAYAEQDQSGAGGACASWSLHLCRSYDGPVSDDHSGPIVANQRRLGRRSAPGRRPGQVAGRRHFRKQRLHLQSQPCAGLCRADHRTRQYGVRDAEFRSLSRSRDHRIADELQRCLERLDVCPAQTNR